MATICGIINIIQEKLPFLELKVQQITKNKVPLTGLCMMMGNGKEHTISPIIYLDQYLNDDVSDEIAAEMVMQTFHSSGVDIDLTIFKDRDYVLEHLYLAYQQEDDSVSYLHRNTQFDGIMEYVYIRDTMDDCNFSVKVTKSLLNSLGISVEEAWEVATAHTSSEINIESIAKTLAGITSDDDLEYDIETFPMYVMTNSLRMNGASVITNQDYIKQWAEARGFDKLVVIFASIHEVILLPASEIDSLEYVNDMMREVNASCVDATEQLADKAFLIDVKNIAS